jgi:hypothetical protein
LKIGDAPEQATRLHHLDEVVERANALPLGLGARLAALESG